MLQKPNYINGKIEGYIFPRNGDYESVGFYKDNEFILELRVSGVAMVVADCGLKGIDVHQWLWNTGVSSINEIKYKTRLIIKEVDVRDGKLIPLLSELEQVED